MDCSGEGEAGWPDEEYEARCENLTETERLLRRRAVEQHGHRVRPHSGDDEIGPAVAVEVARREKVRAGADRVSSDRVKPAVARAAQDAHVGARVAVAFLGAVPLMTMVMRIATTPTSARYLPIRVEWGWGLYASGIAGLLALVLAPFFGGSVPRPPK